MNTTLDTSTSTDSQGSQYSTIVTASRSLCGSLVIKCDECMNLDSIGKKSRKTITGALSDLLTEIQEQGGKLITAIKNSKSCMANLTSLHDALNDIKTFLMELSSFNLLIFHVKGKYKRKCLDLANALHSKRTILFNGVTMTMLSQPNSHTNARHGIGVGAAAGGGGKLSGSVGGVKPVMQIQKHYHK
jgi:hypothetical protein